MVTDVQKKTYTFEEYEALEKEVDTRYEYMDGELFKLPETTKRQNKIVLSFSSLLHPVARKNGCAVFINSIKLKLKPAKNTFIRT